MARLIGEAYVAISPTSAGFGDEADVQIRRQLATLHPNVELGATLDKAALARSIAAIKSTLSAARLDDINIGVNFANASNDMRDLRSQADLLSARLKNIPLSMDDSQGLASAFKMQTAIDKLRKDIKNLNPDINSTSFNAEFYSLEAKVKSLESSLSHLDANMDPDDALEKLAILRLDADQLSQRLANLEVNANDTPMLAKQAQIQANLSALAREMSNMPMDANTLPMEAKLLAMRASIEALEKSMQDVGSGTKMGPEFINPSDLAAANADLDTMAKRLSDVDEYLTRTGTQGSATFGLMEAAVANVEQRLAKLQDTGIINPDDIQNAKALGADLNTLAQSSGLAAAEASSASRGFGLWGMALSALKTQIPLFGGALVQLHFPDWLAQASGTHMLLESIVEFTAVWGPATVALAAFGGLAYKTGVEVYDQFTNMNAVAVATGAKFSGLKGTLKEMESAVQPEVMQLFGDYLTLAGNNAGHFSDMMQEVGKVLDDFGAKLTMDLNSKTTTVFLQKASGDVAGLGVAFDQVGRIIGSLLQAVPGYAEMLLKFGDAFLTVTADAVGGLEPVIALFLKVHGAVFYLGLATTAVLTFGRSFAAAAIAKSVGEAGESLTGFSAAAASWAADFTSDNEKVAEAAGNSGSKLSKLGTGLGNMVGLFAAGGLAIKNYIAETAELVGEFGVADVAAVKFGGLMDAIPFGPVGLAALGVAAVIGGILYEATRNQTTAAEQLNVQMEKLISESNIEDVQQNIATAIAATNKQANAQSATLDKLTGSATATAKSLTSMGPASINPVTGGFSALGKQIATTVTNLNQNSAAVKQYVSENDIATVRIGALTTQFGSAAAASEVLNLAGVKQSDVATANAAAWALDEQKIQATAAAYGFMNQSGSAAAGQLNAINIATGSATKALQTLTSAEQGWITLITGGQTSFDTFEQGFPEITNAMGKTAANASTLYVKVGNLKDKFAEYGATMNGTSQASLAVQQAYAAQLSNGVALYGNLQQLAAASGNTTKAQSQLATGGKAIIAQLLPFAAGSKEATAELSSLAQLMGGPATDNIQTLAKWVGSTTGATNKLNNAQAQLTITASNLTTAAKNLGNALATDITSGQAAAIAKTFGLSQATQGLATAAEHARDTVNQTAVSMAGEYVSALEKAGIGTSQAKTYLDAYLQQLGYGPSAIAAINASLGQSTAAWDKYETAQQANTTATKDLQKATAANLNVFKAIPGTLAASEGYYNSLWAAIVKQDQAMVKSGSDTAGAKTQFVSFATDALGLTTAKAEELWTKLGAQDLDVSGTKAAAAKTNFIQFAENGLKLSSTQAQELWNELGMQNLDSLATKGDSAKNAFISFAHNGLDLSNSSAEQLWTTLSHQYLDTLATKAGETENQFIKTAGQFDLTRAAAEKLWAQLHQLSAGSPYPVNVNETLTGSGKLIATVNQNEVVIGSTGAGGSGAPRAGVSSPAALTGSTGLAGGGFVVSGAGPAGKDSVHTTLAPGELVIPTTHAAQHMAQAKRESIPMASGGFVGAAPGVAATAAAGVGAMATGAIDMTANAMKGFATDLSTAFAAKQAAAGGPLGPGGGSDMANMEEGMKYLAEYLFHGNMRAAAGAAASIAGESGWNPASVGTGGRGLIGWTPVGTISNAAFSGGLSTQLPAIIQFVKSNGDMGVIAEMIQAADAGASISSLAQLWGKGVERYGINDVHATGVNEATSIMNNLSSGVTGIGTGVVTNPGSSQITTSAGTYALGGLVRGHSAGNAYITEPTLGIGLNSGQLSSFGENGPEAILNQGQLAAGSGNGMPGATQYGQQTTNQLLMQLVQLIRQQPQQTARTLKNGMGAGANHGAYAAGS